MTNQTKTNQGNTQSNQANESNVGKEATKGNPSDWNTQKTGQTGTKEQTGKPGGSQIGGKNPPAGGPDQYKPEQPMGGDRTGSGGNPYPPATPERPLMAEGQGKNKGGSKGEFGSSSDESGSRFGASTEVDQAVGETGELGSKPVGEEEE